MKKIFVTLLVALAVSFTAFAQVDDMKGAIPMGLDDEGNQVPITAPIFSFEKESHDFGDIPEGPKVEHEFVFTNTGQEPLIIKNVKASCGCTVPKWPKDPIMPGEESVIKAVYNTKKRKGPFNKSLTITSNAHTPTKRLFIKGKVGAKADEETMPIRKSSIVNESN